MKIVFLVLACFFHYPFIDFAFGQTENMPDKLVSVHHEWGALKEVVVGRGQDLVMPGYCELVDFIYDPAYIDMMKENGGRLASELEPELTRTVIAQIDGLARVLEERGVKVHRPAPLSKLEKNYLTDLQKGLMQLYTRDPMLVIGSNLIETSLKIPMRAKEIFGLRPILREKARQGKCTYVAMPSVSPDFSEDGIYLEGGDVLLNGYEIYVGNSGRGSNKAGIEWLQAFLGPEYRVHEIKLTPDWEHLDCVLALLKPGMGIIHRPGIVGELPDSLKNFDFVEITESETKLLAANTLVLDETTCIIDAQHHRIGEELKKRGHNVIEIPYDAVTTWGGAFRCSHHPLRRESTLP